MRVDDLHSLASCYKKYDPEIELKSVMIECYSFNHIPDLDEDDDMETEMWSEDWDLFKSEEDGLMLLTGCGLRPCRVGEQVYMNSEFIDIEFKIIM